MNLTNNGLGINYPLIWKPKDEGNQGSVELSLRYRYVFNADFRSTKVAEEGRNEVLIPDTFMKLSHTTTSRSEKVKSCFRDIVVNVLRN